MEQYFYQEAPSFAVARKKKRKQNRHRVPHYVQRPNITSPPGSTFSCLFFLLLLPLLAPLYIHECSICIILKSLREPITHFVFLLCIVFRERWQVWEFGKKKKKKTNQEGRMFEQYFLFLRYAYFTFIAKGDLFRIPPCN